MNRGAEMMEDGSMTLRIKVHKISRGGTPGCHDDLNSGAHFTGAEPGTLGDPPTPRRIPADGYHRR